MSPPWLSIGPAPGLAGAAEAVVEGVLLGLPVEAREALDHVRVAVLLVHRLDGVGDVGGDQAVGLGSPGGSMNFSDRRSRRSPFMEVRFISPGCAAGSSRCAASASLVGYRSMLATNSAALVLAGVVDHIDQLLGGGAARLAMAS